MLRNEDWFTLASNIAILSHNFWAICNRREQIASWNYSQKICKQSLWLDYKKEGSQSNSLSNWIGASLFLIVQSEALFTNLLWISTCNLFASVANCSEKSAYQNCNIVGQYCNVAGKRTSGWTVKNVCQPHCYCLHLTLRRDSIETNDDENDFFAAFSV
jgi:hypothetical protein